MRIASTGSPVDDDGKAAWICVRKQMRRSERSVMICKQVVEVWKMMFSRIGSSMRPGV